MCNMDTSIQSTLRCHVPLLHLLHRMLWFNQKKKTWFFFSLSSRCSIYWNEVSVLLIRNENCIDIKTIFFFNKLYEGTRCEFTLGFYSISHLATEKKKKFIYFIISNLLLMLFLHHYFFVSFIAKRYSQFHNKRNVCLCWRKNVRSSRL